MSQSAISRIWRGFGLKPHLVDSFKLSNDPQFVGKGRDIVGLHINPPEAALVLRVTKRLKSKHSIAPHRSCRCVRTARTRYPTTTSGAGQPTSTPHSTGLLEGSSWI